MVVGAVSDYAIITENDIVGEILVCDNFFDDNSFPITYSASARMALSRLSSVKSSRGTGPTQFRVTSRLSFVSQHSSS